MQRFFRYSPLLLCVVLLGACAAPTVAPAPTMPPAVVVAPAANLTNGCVSDYDPAVDYFPQKLTIDYATGWQIEYFNNYKLITVSEPWAGADTSFQYVLVQCGTPIPTGYPAAQVIEVPARSMIAMSTTYLPHLAEFGLIERLVAVDTAAYANTPAVQERIAAGAIAEVGSGPELDVERVLELDPTLVMTFGSGDAQFDSHPQLIAAGVPVAINADFLEPSPLGQAEWGKFIAAFFNREMVANEWFAQVTAAYTALQAQASAAQERPTVLTGAPYQGTWFVPGGESYIARLIADAGGAYVWSDEQRVGSEPMSFEAVFERANNADYWINTGTWESRAAALAEDERFGEFAALQNQQVYNNNARVNAQGGNDYFESGLANPHLLLADLVAILHPELLPEHQLRYYQQLP